MHKAEMKEILMLKLCFKNSIDTAFANAFLLAVWVAWRLEI